MNSIVGFLAHFLDVSWTYAGALIVGWALILPWTIQAIRKGRRQPPRNPQTIQSQTRFLLWLVAATLAIIYVGGVAVDTSREGFSDLMTLVVLAGLMLLIWALLALVVVVTQGLALSQARKTHDHRRERRGRKHE